jgi:hypothetical protein
MKNNHPMLKAFLVPILIGIPLITANATLFDYSVTLNGPSESPANVSPGIGSADVKYDNALHTLFIDLSFSGLQGTTTASHIHAATAAPGTLTAGVATTLPYFTGFPIGVTSGSFVTTLDLTSSSSYNPSYVTANGGTTASAEAALALAMASDEAYLNIHSSVYGGGEIRGFLLPATVPEPSGAVLLGLGGAILAWARRRSAVV